MGRHDLSLCWRKTVFFKLFNFLPTTHTLCMFTLKPKGGWRNYPLPLNTVWFKIWLNFMKEISLCGICQTGFEKFTHRRGRNTGWDDQSSKTFWPRCKQALQRQFKTMMEHVDASSDVHFSNAASQRHLMVWDNTIFFGKKWCLIPLLMMTERSQL